MESGGPSETQTGARAAWPLTAAQEGLWYAQRLAPDNPAFNTAHAVWISGGLDAGAFVRAADRAACEATAFRLRLHEGADGPTQSADDAHVPRIEVVDLGAAPDPERAARDAMRRDRLAPVDPVRDRLALQRLYRLGPGRFVWYLRVHHLAADGYGMDLFASRLCALYAGDREDTGPGAALGAFDALVAEDAAYRHAERRATDAAYWRETLAGMPAAAALSGGFAAAADDCIRHTETLEEGLRDALLRTAQDASQTWPDLIVAVTAEYCRRMSGLDEAVVGVPFMGRLGSASARVPATVMNVLPLRVPAPASTSLAAHVAGVARTLTRGRRHGRYRAEQLRRDLGLIGGQRRLHGPLINVQPFYHPPQLSGVGARLEILGTGPVDDITFGFRGDGSTLDLEIEANPRTYSVREVAAHARRLLAFLATACGTGRLDDIDLATADEAQRCLFEVNATDHPLPDTTLAALIEAGMAAAPQAPAVEFEGQVLSHAGLERRSRALALQLRALGAGADTVVAVALPRSIELVVALVAIVRAGAAYLPLDLQHPDQRLRRIIELAAPACTLVEQGSAERLGDAATLAPSAWHQDADGPLDGGPLPAHAAYVIYTSGSTGAPKGVVVEHRAIVNRLEWMRTHYAFDSSDRILQKTPATFDVSVWEFFLPLLAGATLVVAAPDAHRDPAAIARLIRERGITTLHFVPSMLAAFLESPEARGLAIRRVFCSGEALDADLRDRFHRTVDAGLHNLYGPTEAAVDVSYWPASAEDASRPVPIGFPVWNTRLYVLDARMRALPPGVVGDLYLGGVQLARGYLGRDDLTAERFLPDPHVPGGRIYRTGDLARWRDDGAVEYVGRSDHQVKLRGLRIELGEIEAAIMATGLARQAIVIVREDRPGDRRLVAYLQPDAGYDAVALRTAIAAQLPDYMLPAACVALEDWPVTSNGKLDRAALPVPVIEGDAGRAPQSDTERVLAGLFAQALGMPRVGADADFFALGGDSLAAVHLLLAIQRHFGRDPGLGALFASPTVAALAALLDASADAAADDGLGPLIQLARGDAALAPLFVVHPAGGIAWGYRELATALQPRRPVHGLQSPALDPAQPLPDSIDALAEAYAQRVAGLQPSGPLHLLGWSVGGIIAQAMAAKLRAMGREVGLLALLDAYPADCWRAEPEPDAIAALRALLAIGGHDPDAHPELRSRDAIVAFLRLGGGPLGNLPEQALDGVVRAVTSTNRLVRGHHHQRYDGSLLHVRAGRDHADRPHLQSALWQVHAAKVQAFELPFLHAELTGRDAIQKIAPILDAHLRTFDPTDPETTPPCN